MPLSLRLAVLLAAGSAAGVLHPAFGASIWLGAALAAAATAGGALLLSRPGPAYALAALAILSGGAWRGAAAANAYEHPPLGTWFDARTGGTPQGEPRVRDAPVPTRGVIGRDAVGTEFGAQFPLAVTAIQIDGRWVPMRGGALVTVSGELLGRLEDWRAGRSLEAPVSFRRPARYLNPGLTDHAQSLARRGTPLAGSVKSGALVGEIAEGPWWDEGAAQVRASVRRAMRRHVAPFSETSAAVGIAILIGERADLPREVELRMQEAGTYHVVAISGGNIAMLAAAVLAILWCVHVRFAGAAAVAIAVLLAHAWVVGGGPSVARATAMAAIYLLLRLIDQRTRPVHAIALAAACMLSANPLEIVSAGFWLTFGASGALLLVAQRWPPVSRGRWGWLWVALGANAAVEVVLMPISAFVFERVTVAGLALNLVAVPAMAAVQAAASLCAIADAAGADAAAAIAARVTHVSAQVLLGSSGLVSLMPWATWRVPAPAPWLLAAYYLAAVLWWWASTPPVDSLRRARLVRALSAVLACGWVAIAAAPHTWLPKSSAAMRLTLLDVGQGDAMLLTMPGGQRVMVDAGGAGGMDIGDRVVAPSLRAHGARGLDYLVVTHADLDHLAGGAVLVRDFRPREIWMGVPVAGHGPMDLLRATAGHTTPWRWVQRGDRLEVGGVDLRVHHPPLPDWERQRVRNDDSVVMEARYGAVSLWLTGDISRAVEAELAPLVEPGRIVVLKAAHHGSLTSSAEAWIRRLRPAVVLVSAGRNNLFGHPAPAVLRRYRDVGAEVFRTDQDGQVEVVTNGIYVEVHTYTGRRWRLR